jgi:hypothetical protein
MENAEGFMMEAWVECVDNAKEVKFYDERL